MKKTIFLAALIASAVSLNVQIASAETEGYSSSPSRGRGWLRATRELIEVLEHWNDAQLQVPRQSSDGVAEMQSGNVELSKGSLIYVYSYLIVPTFRFRHYGVYLGGQVVLHFASPSGPEISFSSAVIHKTTLCSFLNGRELGIDNSITTKFTPEEIVDRGLMRLGEMDYSLLLRNCEHVAREIVTGRKISYQVLEAPQAIFEILIALGERVDEFVNLFD